MSLFKKTPSVSMETVGFEGTDCTKNVRKSFSSAVYMRNFRITDDGKLQKRHGYSNALSVSGCYGLYCGNFGGKRYFIYKKDGYLYAFSLQGEDEGFCYNTGEDTEPVCFIFGSSLYIICKSELVIFDSNGFFSADPYIPTVAITAPNEGGGVLFEGLNILSNYAKISFSPNGESSSFVLPASALSVYEVYENGSRVGSTAYKYDQTSHTLTFDYVPSGGVADSLVVTFYVDSDINPPSTLFGRSFCIYGGESDSRVFAYGGDNYIYYSDVTEKGADPLYFPAENFIRVGDGTPVTALCRHYGNLAVFTESDAWYITVSSVDYDGYTRPSFPIFPINGTVGCVRDGAVLINNSPFSVNSNGAYLWSSTTLRDERNAKLISEPINALLPEDFADGCTVFDNEGEGEVWICKSGLICVYNYRRTAWYFYDGIYADRFYCSDGIVYFSNSDGLYRFDESARTDDGEIYNAVWESSFCDFGITGKKNIMRLFVSLIPRAASDLRITVSPNKGKGTYLGKDGCYGFTVFDFSAIDFSNFTFECEGKPSVVRRRLNLRGADSVKLRIENNSSTTLTVDKLLMEASI